MRPSKPLTAKEASQRLGVTKQRIHELQRNKQLPKQLDEDTVYLFQRERSAKKEYFKKRTEVLAREEKISQERFEAMCERLDKAIEVLESVNRNLMILIAVNTPQGVDAIRRLG